MERIFMHPAYQAERAPVLTTSHWLNHDGHLDLDDLRGRVVVLCAFQMLCPESVMHGLPQAMRIREAFDPNEVEVVGLHPAFESHETRGPLTLAAFLLQYGIDIPVAVDAPATITMPSTMESYGIAGTPSLVLIDREGRIRAHMLGRPSDMQLGASIARLVAESRPRPVVRGHRPRLITSMDTIVDGFPPQWPTPVS